MFLLRVGSFEHDRYPVHVFSDSCDIYLDALEVKLHWQAMMYHTNNVRPKKRSFLLLAIPRFGLIPTQITHFLQSLISMYSGTTHSSNPSLINRLEYHEIVGNHKHDFRNRAVIINATALVRFRKHFIMDRTRAFLKHSYMSMSRLGYCRTQKATFPFWVQGFKIS